MTIQEVDNLIFINQLNLKGLWPTLHPGASIPYTKVGLLNTARRKEARYKKNLAILYALRVAVAEKSTDNEQVKTLVASLRY